MHTIPENAFKNPIISFSSTFQSRTYLLGVYFAFVCSCRLRKIVVLPICKQVFRAFSLLHAQALCSRKYRHNNLSNLLILVFGKSSTILTYTPVLSWNGAYLPLHLILRALHGADHCPCINQVFVNTVSNEQRFSSFSHFTLVFSACSIPTRLQIFFLWFCGKPYRIHLGKERWNVSEGRFLFYV